MTISVGIDIGSGVVKTALFRTEGDKCEWLAKRVERIRRRDNMQLAKAGYDEVLEEAGLKPADVDYVATTGEGENVKFATGHFYSMTTHARGAIPLPRGQWWRVLMPPIPLPRSGGEGRVRGMFQRGLRPGLGCHQQQPECLRQPTKRNKNATQKRPSVTQFGCGGGVEGNAGPSNRASVPRTDIDLGYFRGS